MALSLKKSLTQDLKDGPKLSASRQVSMKEWFKESKAFLKSTAIISEDLFVDLEVWIMLMKFRRTLVIFFFQRHAVTNETFSLISIRILFKFRKKQGLAPRPKQRGTKRDFI